MLDALIVTPGSSADLRGRDPRDMLGLPGKDQGRARLAALTDELSSFQERLYAEGKQSVLLVLQGLDASGKDGTIRHVFTGVNPQGCHVTSFKAPTLNELAHDFLWRVHAECPPRGMIGIFNRSHYEDVVTVGVLGLAPEKIWRRRPGRIVEFERLLVEEGTTVLKCFLHVSAEEQRRRFEERLSDPTKRWKYNPGDEETNRRYDEFTAAYDAAISATSTEHAPWYVIPADRNWLRNLAVATVLVETLRRLDPRFPEVPAHNSPQSADL
jgi:PPK2 family polyphosphate:nucleotide phosphotransferase